MNARGALVLVFWLSACDQQAFPRQARGHSDDIETFAERAQPTLARSCAFPACHGDRERGLSLYAVGRARAIENPSLIELQFAPLTAEEISHNLDSVLQFVDAVEPERSELLIRALPLSEGGRGHRGGVLFPSRDDPGYLALLGWIREGVDP